MARPDKRWLGGSGGDSRKTRICGEVGTDVIIPVPPGTTVWVEPDRVLGEC